MLSKVKQLAARRCRVAQEPPSHIFQSSSTTKLCSIAQSLPADILRYIFEIVHEDHRWSLACCALVCRWWNIQSSPVLLRRATLHCGRYTPHYGREPKYISVFGIHITLKRKGTQTPAKFQASLNIALQSIRIVANLQELDASSCYTQTGCVDFAQLQSTVLQLHNLHTLRLGPIRFYALKRRSPCLLPPEKRRHIRTLGLQFPRAFHVDGVQPSNTPALLDVLLWFASIDHLQISETTPDRERMNLLSKYCSGKREVSVSKLTVDAPSLHTYMSLLRPTNVLCTKSLLTIHVTRLHIHDSDVFNTFLAQHPSHLKHCSVAFSSTYFSALSGFPPVRVSNGHSVDRLMLPPSSSLRSFAFSITVAARIQKAEELAPFWNKSIKAVLAWQCLETLKIEIRFDHLCPPIDGDPFMPFLSSLRWSVLNQLSERSSPLQSLQVAVWREDIPSYCFGNSNLCATLPEYADLIKAQLSSDVKDILSFEMGSIPLRDSLPIISD